MIFRINSDYFSTQFKSTDGFFERGTFHIVHSCATLHPESPLEGYGDRGPGRSSLCGPLLKISTKMSKLATGKFIITGANLCIYEY